MSDTPRPILPGDAFFLWDTAPNQLRQQFVILGMCTNPEPYNPLWFLSPHEGVGTNTHRPQLLCLPDLLEVQRWMVGISLEQPEVFVRQSLYFF